MGDRAVEAVTDIGENVAKGKEIVFVWPCLRLLIAFIEGILCWKNFTKATEGARTDSFAFGHRAEESK